MSLTSATQTDTERSLGRCFAAYTRATAASWNGSAARPYAVSVGWTTRPPARRVSTHVRTASASRTNLDPIDVAASMTAMGASRDAGLMDFPGRRVQEVAPGVEPAVRGTVRVEPGPPARPGGHEDRLRERRRVVGRHELAEGHEGDVAHLDPVGPRLAGHVLHREDEERVVRLRAHHVPDGDEGLRPAPDARFLDELPLDRLDDGLVRLDVARRDCPQPAPWAVRLADDEERLFADEEPAHADGDTMRTGGRCHGASNPQGSRAFTPRPARAGWDTTCRAPCDSRRDGTSRRSGTSAISTSRRMDGSWPTPQTERRTGAST